MACGLFAPAALATGSPEPPAAPLPVAAAVGAEVAAVASPQDAQAPADTATASPADAQAPADSATPPATSATDQSGDSAATAAQEQPVNVVVIVRVDSPGNDGPITQSNITVASSTVANGAATTQGGGGTGGAASTTTQQGTPTTTATQDGAGNLVITVRIASPGNGGAVTQTNGVAGASTGTNTSDTAQQVAAPTPAAQPHARRTGAALSRKSPRPQHRQPATVREPVASSPLQAAPTVTEPAAATGRRAATHPSVTSRRHSAVARKPRVTHRPSTLSTLTSGAVHALSPLVPHPSPVADATRPADLSRPVLLALLLAAVAAAATLALGRRVPARRRAASRRSSR